MELQTFTINLQVCIGKKSSLLGVHDLYMEKYVCFLLSRLLGIDLETIKNRMLICKLLNLYQFPEMLRRIKLKYHKNNQFEASIKDDFGQHHILFFQRINKWSLECNNVKSLTGIYTIKANISNHHEIEFSEFEKQVITKLANKRTLNARKNGIIDKLRATGDLNKNWVGYGELDSFGAEIAFCKMANVYHKFLDFSIPSKEYGTDMGDVELPDGTILDVKQTCHERGKLIIEVAQAAQYLKSPINAFVLIVGSFSEHGGKYSLRGFMSKNNLIHDSRKGYLNTIYDYIALQGSLSKYDSMNYTIPSQLRKEISVGYS